MSLLIFALAFRLRRCVATSTQNFSYSSAVLAGT